MRLSKRMGIWCGADGWQWLGTIKTNSDSEPVVVLAADDHAKLITQNERLKRKVKRLEANAKLDREYLLARD